jgi:hypothetical protein
MLQAKRRSMFYTCPVCGAWPHIATRECTGCEGARGGIAVLLERKALDSDAPAAAGEGGATPPPIPIEALQ